MKEWSSALQVSDVMKRLKSISDLLYSLKILILKWSYEFELIKYHLILIWDKAHGTKQGKRPHSLILSPLTFSMIIYFKCRTFWIKAIYPYTSSGMTMKMFL